MKETPEQRKMRLIEEATRQREALRARIEQMRNSANPKFIGNQLLDFVTTRKWMFLGGALTTAALIAILKPRRIIAATKYGISGYRAWQNLSPLVSRFLHKKK